MSAYRSATGPISDADFDNDVAFDPNFEATLPEAVKQHDDDFIARMKQRLAKYDPSEPRDESGKWTNGGDSKSIREANANLTGDDRIEIKRWISGTNVFQDLRHSDAFGKVIDKMPQYEGTVYRGLALGESVLASLKPGTIKEITKHSSTSLDKMKAQIFALDHANEEGTQAAIFTIHNAHGGAVFNTYDLGHQGMVKNEKEVIIKSGARIEVLSVNFNAGDSIAQINARWVP